MPYYLSSYIGAGTDFDPCIPRGADQSGWGAIDRRADDGASIDGNGLNACFLYLPVHNPDSRLYKLADEAGETIPPLVRAGVAARLNATISFSRLDDLIAEHLVRPPGNMGKPLPITKRRPTIYLGPRLSPNPGVYPVAASFTESWNAADSGSLTADLTWTETIGTAWGITSNRARIAGAVNTCRARAEHDTDTDDHVVSATLATFTRAGGNLFGALLARLPSDATAEFYRFFAVQSTTGFWLLEKQVAGVNTTLANSNIAPAAGMIMELSALASTIQGKFDSTVVGPVTDVAVTGWTRGGIDAFLDNAGNVLEFDNWALRDDVLSHVLARGIMNRAGHPKPKLQLA